MNTNRGRGRGAGSERGRGRGTGGDRGRGRGYSSDRGGSERGRGAGAGAGGGRGHREGGSGRGGRGGTVQSPEQRNLTFANVKIDQVKVDSLEKPKKINNNSLVVRGDPGNIGSQVSLLTNYFPLKLPSGPFYQYAVSITPECPNKRLCYSLIVQHEKEFKDKNFVYDGQSMLFTQQPLNKDKRDINLVSTASYSNEKYQVNIQFVSEISSNEMSSSVAQLFNILFRRSLALLKLQQIGRNHYNMDDRYCINVPEHRVKILPGLLATIYTGSKGFMFNADVVYKVLRTDTILEYLIMLRDRYPRNYKEIAKENIAGSIVLCLYNNKTVYIDEIAWDKTPKDTFEKKGGGKISFAQYFKEQYNREIKDLNQPLLLHRVKQKNSIEYFVPELCSLTGLTNEMRSNSRIMRDLKTKTGLNPTDRAKQIVAFAKESIQNAEFADALKKWQFVLDPRLIEVTGRMLPKQKIVFADKKEEDIKSNSSWDIKSISLLRVISVTNWVVVGPRDASEDITNFLKILKQVSNPLKITYSEPEIHLVADPNGYKDVLSSKINPDRHKFVLVVLPDNGKNLYDTVKQILILQKPVPSQCVLWNNISNPKGIHSKATKIAVQLTSKLGGAPWTVNFAIPPQTMIIGMDVYHSGELGIKKKKSIVGFSASMDQSISRFYSRVLIQDSGKEIVKSLQPCMDSALKKFKEINKVYPKCIVFYRDGVGEGQIKDVLEKELAACQESLKQLNITDTKLCFIVVLKRIHTRLFSHGSEGNLDNPQPGTVVDTGITGPDTLEFFLISQSVNQGTATPIRYQCIYNDAGFKANDLQVLTYQLCHVYYNWFGTIKVPAPCQYAHKIAFLFGQSIHKEDEQRRLNNRLFYL